MKTEKWKRRINIPLTVLGIFVYVFLGLRANLEILEIASLFEQAKNVSVLEPFIAPMNGVELEKNSEIEKLKLLPLPIILILFITPTLLLLLQAWLLVTATVPTNTFKECEYWSKLYGRRLFAVQHASVLVSEKFM